MMDVPGVIWPDDLDHVYGLDGPAGNIDLADWDRKRQQQVVTVLGVDLETARLDRMLEEIAVGRIVLEMVFGNNAIRGTVVPGCMLQELTQQVSAPGQVGSGGKDHRVVMTGGADWARIGVHD
jgi:hypothetical protein